MSYVPADGSLVQKACRLQGRKSALVLACRQLPPALCVVCRHVHSYFVFDSLLESFVAEFELTNRLPVALGKPITHDSAIEKINQYGLHLISRFLKGISACDIEFKTACAQIEEALFDDVQTRIPHIAQPNMHRLGGNPSYQFEVPLPSEIQKENELADALHVLVSELATIACRDPRNLVALALRSYVSDVFWYTMGTKAYLNYEAYYELGFPCKPRDVLGVLRISTADGSGRRWFYYKDNHPDHYGWGGQTHSECFYFVGNDLSHLLSQMRRDDVLAFGRAMYRRSS